MQVKKQQLEPDVEKWTGSKLGKEYIKAVYCHPVYLTPMQSTSWETLGWKKQESSRKTSISALLTVPEPLTVWLTINCGKFWKRWEYQTIWPVSWEACMQVRKQQVELGIEQQSGSK